jgi:hypothetical protein
MTRVDLKGERPDDATETRGMAEQARLDGGARAEARTRTCVLLRVLLVAGGGGRALCLRR